MKSPPPLPHSPWAASCWFLPLAAALSGACASGQLASANDDAPALAVVSWNVNYGVAGDPEALAFLEETAADIVILQETTAAWEQALRARLGHRYPHMTFHHCCGAGGLAVLSAHPIRAEEVLPAVTWFPAWRGVVDTPLGPVQILNVHLRPPFHDDGSVVKGIFTTPAIRTEEMSSFAAALEPGLPTLVAGDFNEAGGGAVTALRERGLLSVLEVAGDGSDTWRWPSVPFGLRLDHVFFDDTALALTQAQVVQRGRSDHLPIVARFQRAAPKPTGPAGAFSSGSLSQAAHATPAIRILAR